MKGVKQLDVRINQIFLQHHCHFCSFWSHERMRRCLLEDLVTEKASEVAVMGRKSGCCCAPFLPVVHIHPGHSPGQPVLSVPAWAGVGPEDLPKSLPTPIVQWYCETNQGPLITVLTWQKNCSSLMKNTCFFVYWFVSQKVCEFIPFTVHFYFVSSAVSCVVL